MIGFLRKGNLLHVFARQFLLFGSLLLYLGRWFDCRFPCCYIFVRSTTVHRPISLFTLHYCVECGVPEEVQRLLVHFLSLLALCLLTQLTLFLGFGLAFHFRLRLCRWNHADSLDLEQVGVRHGLGWQSEAGGCHEKEDFVDGDHFLSMIIMIMVSLFFIWFWHFTSHK